MRLVVAGILVVILAILWMDVGRHGGEEFEPPSDMVVNMLMETLSLRGVRVAPGGVSRIEVSERDLQAPVRNSMFGVIVGAPTFSSIGTARIDVHLRGGDVVRLPSFTVRGTGDTREASQDDVNSGIDAVKSAFEERARARGFME